MCKDLDSSPSTAKKNYNKKYFAKLNSSSRQRYNHLLGEQEGISEEDKETHTLNLLLTQLVPQQLQFLPQNL
jgi:hypothetical protein